MPRCTMRQMIPGLWAVSDNGATVSALGTIRRTAAGYAFVGQSAPGPRRELQAAGLDAHLWSRDGFTTPEAALAHVQSMCG